MRMKFLEGCCLCCLLFFTTGSLHAQQPKKRATATPKDTASYTYKITDAANGSFGYEVYRTGKLVIHQPTVPALPGNEGFKTRDGAEKVVQLVIRKIKKGEIPPTVSMEEMKKLKAI